MHFAEFGKFVHRGLIDFFLSVKAGTHRPLVKQVQKRTGLDQANGLCVRQEVKSNFGRNAAIEESIFRPPRIMHRSFVEFPSARILTQQNGRDVVEFASIRER